MYSFLYYNEFFDLLTDTYEEITIKEDPQFAEINVELFAKHLAEIKEELCAKLCADIKEEPPSFQTEIEATTQEKPQSTRDEKIKHSNLLQNQKINKITYSKDQCTMTRDNIKYGYVNVSSNQTKSNPSVKQLLSSNKQLKNKNKFDFINENTVPVVKRQPVLFKNQIIINNKYDLIKLNSAGAVKKRPVISRKTLKECKVDTIYEIPFKCEFCKYRTVNRNNFLSHMTKYHDKVK